VRRTSEYLLQELKSLHVLIRRMPKGKLKDEFIQKALDTVMSLRVSVYVEAAEIADKEEGKS